MRRWLFLWVISVSAIAVACGDDQTSGGLVQMGADGDEDAGSGEDVGAEGDVQTPDAQDDRALPDMPWDPTEPGFYRVGYRTEEISYTPPGLDTPRSLRVVIWYPTLDEEGSDATYGGLLPRPGILENAAVALDAPAPVLVFSHGSTSFAEQSFFMTEFFTSHGWIVVAMDHTGNLFRDRGVPPDIFAKRPQDVSAVIDHVYDLPDGDPLSGLFSDDIALSGHSFGGYTTLAVSGAGFLVETVEVACATGQLSEVFCDYFTSEEIVALFNEGFRDERVKVAMPQAPFGGPVFGAGVADIDIPVLLFTARADRTLPASQDGDPIWDGLDGEDDLRVDIVTAGHFTFSNACGFGLGIGEDDGCGPGFIGPERAFHIVNTYALVFARRHLLGDTDHLDILDGSTEIDGDVLLQHK